MVVRTAIPPDPPRRRAYEQTWWGKLYYHYRLAMPIVSGFLVLIVAVGFQFQTPAMWFAKIEDRITAVEVRAELLEAQLQNGEDDRREIMRRLNVLIRFQCLDLMPRERTTQDICQEVAVPP